MMSIQWGPLDSEEAINGKRGLLLCEWNAYAAPHCKGKTYICIGRWDGEKWVKEVSSTATTQAALEPMAFSLLPEQEE